MPIARCATPTIAGSRATRGSKILKKSPRRLEQDRQTERVGMSDTAQTKAAKMSRAAATAAENMASATLRPELPTSLMDLFEKSVARAKDAHEKVVHIVQHSAEAFEEAASCANRGSVEYRKKLMEIARANADAAFDLARDLVQAKTLPELF